MAKVVWKGKTIKFKNKVIGKDNTPMNKDIALENLKIFDEFMKEHNIPYQLLWGSQLGAVRDKGFIPHDEDIDMGTTAQYFDKIIENIEDLTRRGLEIVRFDERGQFSLYRNNEYMDVVSFNEYDENAYITCNMFVYPKKFIDDIIYINFYDTTMPVSQHYEEFMLYEYGETWTTPIKYEATNKGILSSKIKAVAKMIMPKWLKFKFWEKTALPEREKYLKKYEKYKKEHNL